MKDLWVNPAGEIIVVDYKATAKSGEVTIDADWQTAYKRQMEVYQWLVRQQGLTVSDTGYFVYCNGQDAEAFDGRVEFAVRRLPYTGSDYWIEDTLVALKNCLLSTGIPKRPADWSFAAMRWRAPNRRLEILTLHPRSTSEERIYFKRVWWTARRPARGGLLQREQ